MDRMFQEFMASICSWRVDMGLMGPNRDNQRAVTQSAPPTPRRNMSSSVAGGEAAGSGVVSGGNLEDPEYFQRLMHSRYPEHMLYCPQTSLYPVFFFLMERWGQRRALAAATAAAAAAAAQPAANDTRAE